MLRAPLVYNVADGLLLLHGPQDGTLELQALPLVTREIVALLHM